MNASPVVSTEWLEAHLHDKNLRVIDVRGHVLPASEPPPHYFSHYAEYSESHLPGAVFVDWVTDLTNPESPNKTQIATPEAFSELMSTLGIDENIFVVAYDDASGMFSARMWWALNYYGHTKVAILDGGWQKWLAEGRPITREMPIISKATFIPRPDESIRRTIDEVSTNLNSNVQLLDVRSIGEFEGQVSRAKRKGHIPNAINLPRKQLLDTNGQLLPLEALREKFDAVGLNTSDQPIVVYCNGGVSATYGMLALRMAGVHNVAVYDGSWKEWGNDDSKPIE